MPPENRFYYNIITRYADRSSARVLVRTNTSMS